MNNHPAESELSAAHGGALPPSLGAPQAPLRPTELKLTWGPVLAQESVALDDAERILVKVIEWWNNSRIPPALLQERQKRARGGDWRPVDGIAISFLHCHALRATLDQVLEMARNGEAIDWTAWGDDLHHVAAASEFPMTIRDKCAVRVIDRREKSLRSKPRLLVQEHQRVLGYGVPSWRTKSSFGVSINAAQPILDSLDKLIEGARG